MRLFLLFALLVPAALAQPADQPVASRIEQVTVYQNGARIERFAETRLRPGTTDLVFGDLPPGLDASRVEVVGEGDFTLLGVATRRDYADTTAARPDVERLRSRIAVLDDTLAALRIRLDVLAQEQQLLLANQDLGPNTTVAEIRAAAEFYRSRLTDIKLREQALRGHMATFTAERARIAGEIGQLTGRGQGNVPSAIVVTVGTAQAGAAQFRLRYVVGGASWQPRYDARVAALDRLLDLTFNAAVEQHTGEDWQNVRLTLSTGDPYARATQPTLVPLRLGFSYPSQRRRQAQGRVEYGAYVTNPTVVTGTVRDAATGEGLPGANVIVTGTQIGTATDVDGRYRLDLPPGTRGTIRAAFVGYFDMAGSLRSDHVDFYLAQGQSLQEVVVSYSRDAMEGGVSNLPAPPPVEQVERTTTVEYVINTPYTLPSDGRPRVVEVQKLALPARYTYYTAPRVDRAAYLTARLPDWDRHGLQPGDVNLYLEGAFVGSTHLDSRTPDDTLTLSLGRDAGVVVARTQVEAQRKRSFFGNRVAVGRGYRIEVRNTRTRPVEVVIEDQIPLSADSDISVEHSIEGGGVLDEETGIVRWTRALAPGETATVAFSYEVRHPRGRSVVVD